MLVGLSTLFFFLLPIILFSNSQNNSETFSYENAELTPIFANVDGIVVRRRSSRLPVLVDDELLQHVLLLLLSDSVSALYDNWLSSTASMTPYYRALSLLSQACLLV